MKYPTSKKLIDRKEQREKIKSLLAKNREGTAFAALEFYGIGGLGKTRTLEVAKQECREQNLPFIVIDFLAADKQNTQHLDLDILLRICDNLDRFTDFTQGRLFVASLKRKESENDPKDGSGLLIDQDTLAEFRGYLAEALQDQPLILMLDSTEQCPDKLFYWLGRNLLGPLVMEKEIAPIIVFMAGRGPRVSESGWQAWLRAACESLRLDPLEFENSREHISALAVGSEYNAAAKDIYALSNGHSYSTEAIVFWLNSLGVKVGDVGAQREEMARRLREEVIRKYILSDADEWVLPFLEVASYFRWFTSGFVSEFLQEYRPDLGVDQPVIWYTARLLDLQRGPLNLVFLGKDHYQLEPTLQKLLHVVMVILEPEEAKKIHTQAAVYLEQELQKNVRQPAKGLALDNVSAAIIVEILYHKAHLAVITGNKLDMTEELTRIIKTYFNPKEPRDGELLEFLRISLEQDAELIDILQPGVMKKLTAVIKLFFAPMLTPQQPYQLCHLTIEHTPPSEFRVSWYQSNYPVVPTERVISVLKFDLDEWRTDTEDTGKTAFSSYLPEGSQRFVRTKTAQAILLTTNRPDIPWELLHDDHEFLCLSRPMGRRPKSLKDVKDLPERSEGPLRALVVGNPCGDLPGAEQEALAVAEALEHNGVVVELFLRQQATAKLFAKRIHNGKFDLIHFAGHGYYEPKAPNLSGLQFAEGPMPAEELGRQLSSKALVFLSACETGLMETIQNQIGMIGGFVDGVAARVLLGGALGCVAPMWGIKDGDARDFSISFYENLLSGKVIGESVRQARLCLYNRNKSSGEWKPWALYGDPTNILPF